MEVFALGEPERAADASAGFLVQSPHGRGVRGVLRPDRVTYDGLSGLRNGN